MGIGEGMFIYFLPIYLQQLGADTMTIAGVFGLFGLTMMWRTSRPDTWPTASDANRY